MIDLTQTLVTQNNGKPTFGINEERAIISLAQDYPEFFSIVARFVKPQMFQDPSCQLISAIILNALEKYDLIPSRLILRDMVLSVLNEDQQFGPVLELIDRPSDPREVPVIRDRLTEWAKKSAYGLLYSPESMMAYEAGQYDVIEKIIKDAERISDTEINGLWLLDSAQVVLDPQSILHLTTGFPSLDKIINNGGPSKKEVFIWMGGTNSGKSVLLCNNAITSYKGPNDRGGFGQNVLFVTFELDKIKTAMRCLGVLMESTPMNTMYDNKGPVFEAITKHKATYDGNIFITELPPDECSVNHIYSIVDIMKRSHGWKPDVIILDYMDLMVSRRSSYNDGDYSRQKSVANEIRGLAKNENVLIYSATQLNRGDGSNQIAGLDRAAESYGKQFSMDYVVTINQSPGELAMSPPQFRLFVAKNRNGQKGVIVSVSVDFSTMFARDLGMSTRIG